MESIIAAITLLLFCIYAGLILYYRHGWLSIPIFNPSGGTQQLSTRITIVIPARNEEKNIARCLQAINDQAYPKHLFEVIVVDDHSTDGTAEIVGSFNQGNIRCLALSNFVNDPINSYKKKAIEIAISKANGELIITTDADCVMGVHWLNTMARYYEEHDPVFIAAPVKIDCSRSFFERFQTVDFMILQGITGSSIQKNLHSMCNGANMAYTKKAFEEAGGFTGIDAIASGDDMLLMHKINLHFPGRIHFLKSADAIVTTKPSENLTAFLNQRIRWASKADKYDDNSILPVLIVVYFFNVLLFVLPIVSIFYTIPFAIAHINFSVFGYWCILLILKTAIEITFLLPVSKFFKESSLLPLFFCMQPFHIVYTVVAGWFGRFGSYQWKGRTVK